MSCFVVINIIYTESPKSLRASFNFLLAADNYKNEIDKVKKE